MLLVAHHQEARAMRTQFRRGAFTRQTHMYMGGPGCGVRARNLKMTKHTKIVVEERSREISPWGLVVFTCLDCDVREVS